MTFCTSDQVHLRSRSPCRLARLMIPVLISVLLITGKTPAQSAPATGKFLGNITTRNQVLTNFTDYWNCIAGETECKWPTVESQRDSMVWTGFDRIATFARERKIPWRFHSLFTSGSYPAWVANIPDTALLNEIGEWMDLAAARYPDVTMIDVFNEASSNYLPFFIKKALGGNGTSGFDWAIKAFSMARQRWPHALLIYNDFNNIEYESSITWTMDLVTALQQAKAPIDIIGCQANSTTPIATATMKQNIDRIAGLGLPVHISAFEVGSSNDSTQAALMREKFPMFWNHPKVIGVTYWGYVVEYTSHSGTGLLTSDGIKRPALTWLMDFVKNNPNPPNDFPDLFGPSTAVKYPAAPEAARIGPFRSIAPDAYGVFDLQGRCIGSHSRVNRTDGQAMASQLYIVPLAGSAGHRTFSNRTFGTE